MPDFVLTDTGEIEIPSQEENLEWATATCRRLNNYPLGMTSMWRAGKLFEEAGEVAGAITKRAEGRKTDADVRQEAAQTFLTLRTLAAVEGFDLFEEAAKEWNRANENPPALSDSGER